MSAKDYNTKVFVNIDKKDLLADIAIYRKKHRIDIGWYDVVESDNYFIGILLWRSEKNER